MKFLILKIMAICLIANNAMAREPDWGEYAKILSNIQQSEKNSTTLTLVNYSALKKSAALEKVYQQVSNFPIESLSNKQEKLAFYINTYNILALKMVLDHWPVQSIKEVGNIFSPVWGKAAGMINGRRISLDDIENNIIRPIGEPRIHLAIVCASVSCPDLRNEPYTAVKLEQQLESQTQVFLRNPKKGLFIANNEIIVSKIFKWFKQDFDKFGGVDHFIHSYRDDLPLSYPINADLDYDWSVNGY